MASIKSRRINGMKGIAACELHMPWSSMLLQLSDQHPCVLPAAQPRPLSAALPCAQQPLEIKPHAAPSSTSGMPSRWPISALIRGKNGQLPKHSCATCNMPQRSSSQLEQAGV